MNYPFGGPGVDVWPNRSGSNIHALSIDGGFVAMREDLGRGSSKEQIVIRRSATGEVTKGLLIDQQVSNYTPIAFSANSQYVAVGATTWYNRDPAVHVFEMQTGREVKTLRGHRGPISAARFHV